MATDNNGVVFNEQHFEKKLYNLKDTQESIQSLSSWCLHNKSHFKSIIKCWLRIIKKAKIEQRLTLFYLANDVIQHSKKKMLHDIVKAWEPALKDATTLVREEKIHNRIQRIFKIWSEREVYSNEFIGELISLLTPPPKPEIQPTKAPIDFEANILVEKIRHCKNYEDDTDAKQRLLNESQVKITDVDSLRASLKDKKKTDDFFHEFENSVKRMEDYVQALEVETQERLKLINLLEQADQFYETQRGDVKVVCLAYKQFGNQVKGVKRKLEDMIPSLPKRSTSPDAGSPLPTPDVNAPSPTSSTGSDLELPDAFGPPTDICTTAFQSKPGMDLDSRITSFLAAGTQPASFMSLSQEATSMTTATPPLPPPPDPFSFYTGMNHPFGGFSSLLAVPPPPPPPPPLLPPPMFNDLPKPDPPPLPPMSLMSSESWSSPQGHHPLPSRIPSWNEEQVNNGSSNTKHNSSSTNPSRLFSSRDVDLRANKRPIDHRNLISLTSGPDTASMEEMEFKNQAAATVGDEEIPDWLKDVLKAQEESRKTPRVIGDLNEQVNDLLDSFDPDAKDLGELLSTRESRELDRPPGTTPPSMDEESASISATPDANAAAQHSVDDKGTIKLMGHESGAALKSVISATSSSYRASASSFPDPSRSNRFYNPKSSGQHAGPPASSYAHTSSHSTSGTSDYSPGSRGFYHHHHRFQRPSHSYGPRW